MLVNDYSQSKTLKIKLFKAYLCAYINIECELTKFVPFKMGGNLLYTVLNKLFLDNTQEIRLYQSTFYCYANKKSVVFEFNNFPKLEKTTKYSSNLAHTVTGQCYTMMFIQTSLQWLISLHHTRGNVSLNTHLCTLKYMYFMCRVCMYVFYKCIVVILLMQ